MENKLRTLAARFLTYHDSLNILGRGSPREHFCQVILKLVQWFLTRRFLIILYRYKGKINPAPWRPRFLTNHNGSNNLGRGLLKEHLFVCVEVLQPSQPNGSCRARSIYLSTRLLGRLSPLSG